MKKLILFSLITFFACACGRKENSPTAEEKAKEEKISLDDKSPNKLIEVSDTAIDAKSFISDRFVISPIRNGHFDLTVFFSDRSFMAPIQFMLDGKNITKSIYDDLKTRSGKELEIWVDLRGKVKSILLRNTKMPGDDIPGSLLLFSRGEYPINSRSGD
jgi:hypothetical protein